VIEIAAMTTQATSSSLRIRSIDILRGAVMVLMAIDHVRVYSGLPAGGAEAGIFFTRWVTHFCAPVFVFLAGTAAFLHGRKVGSGPLARFLLTRGLLLVLLELSVIRLFWTFNLNVGEFNLAGVIWMLGWSMVVLALLVRLRPVLVGGIGLAVILLQQVFAFVPGLLPQAMQGSFGLFWEYVYPAGMEAWPRINILYVLVPWVGVMAAGYGFGAILMMEAGQRDQLCRRIGGAAIALFVIGAFATILLEPAPDEPLPLLFRLLNQQKYPASQLYLLMTLGPAIALLPLAERAQGWFAQVLTVFGRVPLFYYLAHLLLIHLSALLVNVLRAGAPHQEWYDYAPFAQVPFESQWSLGLLYVVFVVDVVLLYWACRWYAAYKFNHPGNGWLKYL
jgi:uncharacterized membrane protein